MRVHQTGTVSLVILLAVLAAPIAAQPPLLSSSAPGAFGVRYLADRAVVTYTVEQPAGGAAEDFALRVRLPEKVRWGFLGRESIPADQLGWEDGLAVVRVPYGSGRLHLGWAGEACLPPEGADIPIFLGDRRVGSLRARFDLEGMQASGEAPEVGPGFVTPRVELAQQLDPSAVSLTVGDDAVRRWRRTTGGLEGRAAMPIAASPRLSLQVSAEGLNESPIARIVFPEVKPATEVVRIADDAAPEGVLVEAEAFTNATGTPPRVEPGSHLGTSGDACVFTFIGDGSTLGWKVRVPESGLWDLYLRVSQGDVGAWRVVEVDGKVPEGLELVQLPGTGGWGHAEGEWWIVRVTGNEGGAAPLQLDAGEHTVRMTGVLTTHLNLDYLLLAKHE
ncbi:MAG TPA: hypothetical protein DEP45_05985 [Armatimonadetes bacterium]|nr:hypothetical protein [Armatimonadota bacterium]